jgi:dihydroxyacetone kinase
MSLRGPFTCGVGRRIARYSEHAWHGIKRGGKTLGERGFSRVTSNSPLLSSPKLVNLDTFKSIVADMKSKAFFSDPTRIVDHMCGSLAAQNPSLRYDDENKGQST